MRGVIKSVRELESLQRNTPGAGYDRPVEPENEAHVEDLVIGAQLSRAHQTVSNVPGKAFATTNICGEAFARAGDSRRQAK